MPKFFALLIMKDLTITRSWMDSAMALDFLKKNEGCKVYRMGNDQEGEILYADPDDEIIWKDIPSKDYKIG